MEETSKKQIMNPRREEEIGEARHIILRAMNETQANVRTISGNHFERLRKTCKNGNWSYLAKDLKVRITYWELKCIAQRPNKQWLLPFTTIVRDQNFAEFLYRSLKWDEEHCTSEAGCRGDSENEKTRQYIASFMKGKGYDHLVGGITAGVALRELKKVAVFGDPAWEEKFLEIVHDRAFASILIGDLRDAYLRRRRMFKKNENPSFVKAQEYVAKILRERPNQDQYNVEEIANIMIVDTSIRGLKLLALSSFLKINYNAAMSEAFQAIEEMVFSSAAAHTVYWAIFDELVATGELFRQKLDPDDSEQSSPGAEMIPVSPQEMPIRNLNSNKRRSTNSLKKKLREQVSS